MRPNNRLLNSPISKVIVALTRAAIVDGRGEILIRMGSRKT